MAFLLSLVMGGWRFLTGPVGRWVALAVVVVALLAGVHHHGTTQGRDGEKAAEARRMERARKDVAKREAKAVQITAQSRANLDRERVRIQTRTVTLIKKVTEYVTPAADTRCIVPVGFVRGYNAAVTPELPPASGGPLDAPSGVALSDVLTADVENFGTAYQWRAEALTWRAWYEAQKASWDAPPPL
jgi:hypothetical protein